MNISVQKNICIFWKILNLYIHACFNYNQYQVWMIHASSIKCEIFVLSRNIFYGSKPVKFLNCFL